MSQMQTQALPTLIPGTAAYYIARFAPPAERAQVTHWLLWFAQIDQIATQAKDPGIARLKLDWWHREIDRLNQAQHPLAQALAPQVQATWQTEQMHRVLEAAEQRILQQTPVDTEALRTQCDLAGGSRAMLLANNAAPELQAKAVRLGRYHAIVERIHSLHRDLQRDYLSLPSAWLRAHQIALDDLTVGRPLPGLAAAITALLTPYETPVIQALPALRREPLLQHPLRQTAQTLHLVRKLRRHGFTCHQQDWQLTPLQNLWYAWRMR